MIETTLCYIKNKNAYLLMHRTKKENDVNADKWIGVGGKLKSGESPLECVLREIKEETGVRAKNLTYRAKIYFNNDIYPSEIMHLFTADGYDGEINYDCDEGVLEWVDQKDILSLPLWEGDKIFLERTFNSQEFFTLNLFYSGDKLIDYSFENK